AFHCRHGKAYLFHKVANVTSGVKEDRMMMTGMHTFFAILCFAKIFFACLVQKSVTHILTAPSITSFIAPSITTLTISQITTFPSQDRTRSFLAHASKKKW
ncbi:hypothetical protein ACJX0J_009910, partial [Zea mays]